MIQKLIRLSLTMTRAYRSNRRAINYLAQADQIVGHNIINHDIPVIRKLYPFFEPEGEIIDTLFYHVSIILI